MPGLARIITTHNHKGTGAHLDAMLGPMARESFYNSGSLVLGPLGLCVGWAVHAGSFSDCLPIWNERQDICLVFSGEEFSAQRETLNARAIGQVKTDLPAPNVFRLGLASASGSSLRSRAYYDVIVIAMPECYALDHAARVAHRV